MDHRGRFCEAFSTMRINVPLTGRLSPARQMAPESSERNLEKIIRTPEVLEVTGLSKATIWRRVRSGDFPVPVKLRGPASRSVRWKKAEVAKWIESRPLANN